jgi:hypothetical protein
MEPPAPANWREYLGDLPYSSSSDEYMETETLSQNSEDVEMEPAASQGQFQLYLFLLERLNLSQATSTI